jgi:hypothetical protein
MEIYLVNVNYIVEGITEESYSIPCADMEIAKRELKNEFSSHIQPGRIFSDFFDEKGNKSSNIIEDVDTCNVGEDAVYLYEFGTDSTLTIDITKRSLINN